MFTNGNINIGDSVEYVDYFGMIENDQYTLGHVNMDCRKRNNPWCPIGGELGHGAHTRLCLACCKLEEHNDRWG
jgi:hypothetical protein